MDRLLSRSYSQSPSAIHGTVGGVPATSGVDDLHELRVRIPVDLHRQLLSLKVLRGRSLAETVSLALDIYFSQVKSASSQRPEDSGKEDEPARS